MEDVRIRLAFDDRDILSKSQKSEGLKRCWLLLKPQPQSISDLSSYLLRVFDLEQSCPNGLLLSMDGFVLPPFESTFILKDKDIIRVKKKRGTSSDIAKLGEAANSFKELEIVEKQPVNTSMLLLANEEFDKETGGHKSEPKEDEEDLPKDTFPGDNSLDGNAVSKKRKASKKLNSPRVKKQLLVVPDCVQNDVHTEHIGSCHDDGVLPTKSLQKKEKVSDVKSTPNLASTSGSTGKSDDNVEAMPSVKSDELQENDKGIEDVMLVPKETKKVASRSARRKKAKRQWLQEVAKIAKKEQHWKQDIAKAEKKEAVCHSKGLLHWNQSAEKDMHENKEQEEPNHNGDAEDDMVPIVIRPGHIRFEPLGNDQAVLQSQVSVDTFQWNGIISKKKGQKWGKERASSARRNDHRDLDKEYSEMSTVEREIPVNDPIDFDKLPPLPSIPKEGDLVAYRLLELSSSWTPELSSFRVGKISGFNPQASRIMLMPVPEYPIVFKNSDEDASALQPENTLYKEDGSLEIDFSSLVDIRIIKHSNSDPAKAVTGWAIGSPTGNKNAMSSMTPTNNDKQAHAPTPENGEVNSIQRGSKCLEGIAISGQWLE